MNRTMRVVLRGLCLISLLLLGTAATACSSVTPTTSGISGVLEFHNPQEKSEEPEELDTSMTTDAYERFLGAVIETDQAAFSDTDLTYMGPETLFSMTLPEQLDVDDPVSAYLLEHLEGSQSIGYDFQMHLGEEVTILINRYGKVGLVQVSVSMGDSEGALIGWWEDAFQNENDPDMNWMILKSK